MLITLKATPTCIGVFGIAHCPQDSSKNNVRSSKKHRCIEDQEIAGCQLFQVRILERLHQSRQLLIHYLDIP